MKAAAWKVLCIKLPGHRPAMSLSCREMNRLCNEAERYWKHMQLKEDLPSPSSSKEENTTAILLYLPDEVSSYEQVS